MVFGFLDAIEACDEAAVLAFVRGALRAGLRLRELEPALAAAALAHYADFGHSLIYVVKSEELAARLGPAAEEPLLCMLVRSFCYARREDLLPEFRAYGAALARLGAAASADARDNVRLGKPLPLVRNASVADALDIVVRWSATHPATVVFRALADSAALALRYADEDAMTVTDGPIAANTGWLDHTHAITFAEAGERVAHRHPELWAPLLLQIACFLGRNHGFAPVPAPSDESAESADVAGGADGKIDSLDALRESLFDHGRERFIISVHLIKTLFAATRLVRDGLASEGLMTAALDRFFKARIKGRHVLRNARQMLALAADGV